MQHLLHRLLRQGLERNIFPGAAAAVAQGLGKTRKAQLAATGVLDCRDQSAVTADTLFDLASLSKALSTALIYFSLFAEGQIKPDDTLASLPVHGLPEDKRRISLRSLLSHSSGFAAYQPWFRDFAPVLSSENKARLVRLILNEPLAYSPETRCLYSDLGFILLGQLLEELTSREIEVLFRERVAARLGLENEIFYLTSEEKRAAWRQRCAAVEDCPWRGRMIRGEAHDEHCWLLNGSAGHAGLFGTIQGVLSLCGAILDGWKGQGCGCAWSGFLPHGLRRQLPGQSWGLGFDTPTVGASSSGRHFSPSSVGHLGFTGTSFWIDPDKELIVVLLSNRVHPSRENVKIREFRPYFHDEVLENLMKI